MQRHKKLSARILSMALTVAMVATMMPATVFATEGDVPLGASSLGASSIGTIQSFEKLEDRFEPSTGEGASKDVYALNVELNTPFEDLNLPDELTAMVARTTTVTAPAEDELAQDSGKPAVDETTPDEDEAATDDTAADDTVSDNQPTTPSDAEEEVKEEEIKDEDVPLAPEPEQSEETTVTTTEQETIPVTWKSDKEYKSDENGKFIYSAELPEGYILANGVKLPQIYVAVGRQARSGSVAERTKPLDFTATSIEKQGDVTSWGNPTSQDIDALDAEGWKWEYATKTLLLKELNLNVSGDDKTDLIKVPDGSTVKLNSANFIGSNGKDKQGLCSAGTLAIENDNTAAASLTITLTSTKGTVALSAYKAISINGVSVTANSFSKAIYSQEGNSSFADATISASSAAPYDSAIQCEGISITGNTEITATNTGASSTGIYAQLGSLRIESGTVKATAQSNGISTYGGNIEITGGTIEATGTTFCGISAQDGTSGIAISGGSITATGGGKAIEAAGALTITDRVAKYKVGSDYTGETNISGGKLYEGTAQTTVAKDVKISEAPPATPVTFTTLTANGTPNTTDTTELTMTFDKDVANLAAADITVTGATKGTLTKVDGQTGQYKLAISAITVAEGADVNVAVAKTGFTFNPANMNVAVHKAFVPVTDITGVPTTATAGTALSLTGTVAPANATNKTIVWSVKSAGATGATISGSTLNTTAAGTVTVTATITNGLTASSNYTKDFTITVNAAFVPVTDITDVPTTATAGTALSLTGTVAPANATNKTIVWSVKSAGATGATISGSTLNTTAAGTVTVTATITNGLTASSNYTKDFTITVNAAFVPVTDITDVPTTATAGTALSLTGTVAPANATNKTIVWSVKSAGATGATITGSTLNTTAAGTVTVAATITNGLTASSNYTKDFTITVNAAKTPSNIAVTTPPTKTAYTVGQTFDKTGMIVTATYTDGTTAAVSGYTFSPNTALAKADTTITISYTENGTTVTTTQAITVTDAPSTHTITASAGTGGSISPSGTVTVNNGESKTFAISANSNYSISSVSVDGANQGAISTYTFSNVTGNHTISATFSYNGGGSSGGGGGSSSSQTIYTSVPPAYQGGTKIIGNVRVPDYTVEGAWKKNENGTWTFAGNGGQTYVNTWAPIYNPYADVAKGQSAFDWFMFDANGSMMTGWYTDADGNTYYLNPNSDNTLGAMHTGWIIVDGKHYYFNEMLDGTRGKLFRNATTPDGYLVDKNGVWDGSGKQ